MFIAALFTIARTWKQPRYPSADEWMRIPYFKVKKFRDFPGDAVGGTLHFHWWGQRFKSLAGEPRFCKLRGAVKKQQQQQQQNTSFFAEKHHQTAACALGGMRWSRAAPPVSVRRWACGSDLCPGVGCAGAEQPRQSRSGGGPAALTFALEGMCWSRACPPVLVRKWAWGSDLCPGAGRAEAEHPRESWSGGGPAALTTVLRR